MNFERMFILKKLFSICVAILMITASSAMLTSCSCGEPEVVVTNEGKTYYNNKATIITYKLDGQNINTQVNNDKSLALQAIFNNMTEMDVEPECDFSENCMITFDGKMYYVAEDGSRVIKYDDTYYMTSVSDRYILNSIFTDYGVEGLPNPQTGDIPEIATPAQKGATEASTVEVTEAVVTQEAAE